MKHIRSLCPPTRALRPLLIPQPTVRPQCGRLGLGLQNRINDTPVRHYSPTAQLHKIYSKPTNVPPPPAQERDEAIQARVVQIVNENNGLDEPIRLRDALKMIDRSKLCLVQVAAGAEGIPVCKVMNKYELTKQLRDKAKAPKDILKQIELNWAIDSHDLSHRLKQFGNFLSKGRKVELVLTRKKGKRPPTVEEVKNVMDQVMTATKEANAMPVKPMEGMPGKHVVLVVQKKDL
ncbi:hypothetical protein BO70DRAFT_363326 [Aspergillus heteromorphus CBS 117.55]|uniref:Translation initiation factor 3 N-terminal domain-containing protein n=1 Tax=Aspergillus heteromorphus CBS 117.55 TaxID=1448321 RepID=A0A317VWJ7_9EURO|nr:uncharacterized protein BO70DRAFT_363326 [Aspergillus heteromorphus CBS 117.55]PWY77387.1 hypothetical protein BO70DRAFT_363326 [Aspergillus heteromorphus CBS 117.55]